MKIEINRLNDAVHLQAVNEDGNTISMDGAPTIGGINAGFRPMQLLLAGLGGCSSVDLIDILKKQRQDLRDIKITIDGDREKQAAPALFTDIRMHFRLYGSLDKQKVERALDLSVNKYCSVGKILEKTARISYTYEIIDNQDI